MMWWPIAWAVTVAVLAGWGFVAVLVVIVEHVRDRRR